MKKLMMAAAIVCAAVGVQASSVEWSFYEQVRTDKTYSDLTGYSVYVFTETDWATVQGKMVGGELAASDFSGYKGGQGWAVTADYSVENKVAFSSGGSKLATDATLSGTSYVLVLTDLTEGHDAWTVTKKMSIFDEKAEPIPTHSSGTWTINSANTAGYLKASNKAFTVAAPEPTSALLLVLGMAGLALKRKRA